MCNYKPNYVKSTSLVLLTAAEAHQYFGPVILHWKSWLSGERKIQDAKSLIVNLLPDYVKWKGITL